MDEAANSDGSSSDGLSSDGSNSDGSNSDSLSSDGSDGSSDTSDTSASDNADTDTDGTTDGIIEPIGTSVLLRVVDLQGNPFGIARITHEGTEYLTNPAGFLLLEDLAPGDFKVHVAASGYASSATSTTLVEDDHVYWEVKLLTVEVTVPFDADEGIALVHESLQLDIPPNAFVNEYGEPVHGLVEASVATLDPTTDEFDAAFAPMHGVTEANEDVYLRSLGMFDISVVQDGQELQLAPEAYVIANLVLPSDLAGAFVDGDTIPSWWLDPEIGLWVQEETGVVSVDAQDQRIWSVPLHHFSAWNCDEALQPNQLECFVISASQNGTLVNKNVKVFPTVPGLAGFTDYVSTKKTDLNVGGNCAMAQIGSGATVKYTVNGQDLIYGPLMGTGTPSSCNNPPFWGMPNQGCTKIELPILGQFECTPGSSRICPYDMMYLEELGVGICAQGYEYCVDGAWQGCAGANTYPGTETCTTPEDDDCSGVPDNGGDCECIDGALQDCYTGAPGTEDVGECHGGKRTCSGGAWGECPLAGDPMIVQVIPVAENCAMDNGIDNDCDGIANCSGAPGFSKSYGSASSLNIGRSVAAYKSDQTSAVYVAGQFDTTIDFDPDPMKGSHTSAGSSDAFLLKTKPNESGNYAWSKAWGSAGADKALGVTTDASGSVYVVGEFYQAVDFDPGSNAGAHTTTAVGDGDLFVVKYDSAGNYKWSRDFGEGLLDSAFGVAVQGSRVFVTGTTYGTDVLCPGCGVAGQDAFVLSLHADTGVQQWATAYGAGSDAGQAVAIDAAGNVVVTGYFQASADFDPDDPNDGLHDAIGTTDLFVLKLDNQGNHLWSETYGAAAGSSSGGGVAIDGSDNIYVLGRYNQAFEIAPGFLLPQTGSQDILVAKFDAAGNYAWAQARGYGGAAQDMGLGLDVADGRVFFTGRFGGTVNFGQGNLGPATNYDLMFVALAANDGATVWQRSVGGAGDQVGYGVSVLTGGSTFITGSFVGDVTFDNVNVLTNAVGVDIFLAQYSQ